MAALRLWLELLRRSPPLQGTQPEAPLCTAPAAAAWPRRARTRQLPSATSPSERVLCRWETGFTHAWVPGGAGHACASGGQKYGAREAHARDAAKKVVQLGGSTRLLTLAEDAISLMHDGRACLRKASPLQSVHA